MTTRIGLIGCGNLGYPLAHYIGKLGFEALHVFDLDMAKAAKLKDDLERAWPALSVQTHLDTKEFDVVVLALSGPATIAFVQDERNHDLFKGRPVFVSLGRPQYDDIAGHDALHRYLIERGVALLFGFGLEPGLVEILMQDVASRDEAGSFSSLSAVCGGVPRNPIPPLNYDLLFGDRLPAHNRTALTKLDGNIGHCRRFDTKETRFVNGVGILDVYHDGLSPYLLRSPHIAAISSVKQQTARWPGFFDCVKSLISLGLLDECALPGDVSTPSDRVHDLLAHNGKLARNRPDISFVEVAAQRVSGESETLSIVATFDESTKLTGMAQLTSFLAAWTALRIVHSPTSCRSGLTLSHEFFGPDMTRELLAAYEQNVRCTVSTSHRLVANLAP